MGIHFGILKTITIRELRDISYTMPNYDEINGWSTPIYTYNYYYYVYISLFGKIFYYGLLALLWLLNVYYTSRIRFVSYSAFNESREVGHAEYLIFIVAAILCVVHNISESNDAIVFYTCILIGCLSLFIPIEFYLPKIMRIYHAKSEQPGDIKSLIYCPRCGCKLKCIFYII